MMATTSLGGRDAGANGSGSQEPKEFQTSRGWATARAPKQSLADDAGLDEDVVSVKLALDVVAALGSMSTMEMLTLPPVAAPRGFMLDIQKW